MIARAFRFPPAALWRALGLRGFLAAPVVVAASLVLAPGAATQRAGALRPLTTGFFDTVYISGDRGTRSTWLDRSRKAGAGIVRFELSWAEVAPAKRPSGFRADDPADAAYRWEGVDAAVRDAQAHGLDVLLLIWKAPSWAEARGRPADAPEGTWRPDPAEFGRFARAAASRYSGRFRDPATGVRLPRVRRWQVWNEPNLSLYLTPQGRGQGDRFRPTTSPRHYRRMLNAAYASLKRVRRDNLVVTAGTSPFGDLSGDRTAPAWFVRELLCLRGRRRLQRMRCPNPARFDVLAHHPYSVKRPRHKAANPDDVTVSDVSELTRILRVAQRSGRALPRRRKRVWITEFAWDSDPPDPNGVPQRTHAAWLADSLYLLWRQGVDVALWFQVVDSPPIPSFATSYQGGVYRIDGTPKLARRAFRFPFVTERRRSRIRVWGKAPKRGRILIERRVGRRWVTVSRLRTGRSRLFQGRLRISARALLRARVGREASLARRSGVPQR